jgi:hypothetical protein
MIRTSLSETLDSQHSGSSVVSGEWVPVYGPYHLTADQLRMLRESGLLPNLPCVTTEEINGRSKGDFFSKTIAVIQIFFNAFQVTVRAIRGISISQLELAVTAFSLCAIVIYAFQWYRPKDVQVPLTIVKYRGPIPDEIIQRLADHEDQNKLMSLAAGLGVSVRIQVYGSPVPNDTLWQECEDISTSGMLLGSFLFGAIHISGWNFTFPTSIERNIWRVASLLTTTGPILTLLLAMIITFFLEGMSWGEPAAGAMKLWYTEFKKKTGSMGSKICYRRSVFVSSGIYVVARLFILVELLGLFVSCLRMRMYLLGRRIFLM